MRYKLFARHTGNAGVIIYSGEKAEGGALGFDVFARDPAGLYLDTPEAERQQILRQIEAGRLRTLVFTHAHGDHFCLPDVLEAVERNPGLRIITTEEAAGQILQNSEKGVLTVIPAAAQGLVEATEQLDVGVSAASPLRLSVFNAPHMGEQYADVQNLVCLLELEGKRILLPGDAAPGRALYARAAEWSPEFDWLIAPFPLLGLPSSRRQMAAQLRIHHALALHLPRPERDQENWRENAQRVCEAAADGLPLPLFGDKPGTTYRLA